MLPEESLSCTLMFMSYLRIDSRLFLLKLGNMFLLVSDLHVGAIWMGTNMASPYKFGHKISPNISHMKNCIDLNLGKDLCIFTSFHIPVSGFIPLNGFDFYV